MLEILTPARMREAEQAATGPDGESFALMRAAGAATVEDILELFPDGSGSALVLCGGGNNGGDGYIAAALLAQAGWEVRVAALVPPDELKADARRAARLWTNPAPAFAGLPGDRDRFSRPVIPLREAAPEPGDLVVDALFGTGFAGNLPPPVVDLFNRVRQCACAVVAVDIPSGVDAATGAADPATLGATATTTFFRKKIGHVLMPGLGFCGDTRVHTIGIDSSVLNPQDALLCDNAPDLWRDRLNLSPVGAGHKYDRGHAVVLCGPRMSGAAMMAGHAASRAGAGLCTIVSFPHVVPYFANMLSDTIERFAEFPKTLADPRRNLVLLGPGAGSDDPSGLRAAVRASCEDHARRVVLDADALNVFEKDPGALFSVLHEGCVLTPHEGEFARLFPGLGAGGKIERARKAAFLSGATLVLKGPDTVIAAPDGRVVVNTHASADLATAGTGDVLAGLILGFMGRGGKGIDPFGAACAAAWVHGEAARRFGPGLIATDIPDLVPGILSDLLRGLG